MKILKTAISKGYRYMRTMRHVNNERSISTLTLLVFVCTQIAPLEAFATPSAHDYTPPPQINEISTELSSIKTPENYGEVIEFHKGTRNQTIILIQDAHAIPEAQKNIQHLINYFQEEHHISLVMLEGSEAPLDATVFKTFPNKEILLEVFNDYYEKGELSAGVGAAIFNQSPSIYHGIEDWDIYEEGLDFYFSALKNQDSILSTIHQEIQKNNQVKEKIYSKKLFEIDRALENYEAGRNTLLEVIQLMSTVELPEKNSQVFRLLKYSENTHKQELQIEPEVNLLAKRIKHYYKNQNKRDLYSAEAEFNAYHQNFTTSKISIKSFALFLREHIQNHNLLFPISENLNQLAQLEKGARDIKGTQLFYEFEFYMKQIKKKLIKSPQESLINQLGEELKLLKNFSKMELRHSDWKKMQDILTSSQEPHTHQTNWVQNMNLNKHLKPHIQFYENALKRDAVFYRNIQNLLKNNNAAAGLVIAGGFHAEGLLKRFKEDQISYMVVAPRISSLPHESLYQNHMKGELSWKSYFHNQEGKVNLYEAFTRAARDKLLNHPDIRHQSSQILKEWRNQIIRHGADSQTLESTSEYTKFIDELKTTPPKKNKSEISKSFMQALDDFIRRLTALESSNKLTEKNIQQILQPASIPSIANPAILSPKNKSSRIAAKFVKTKNTLTNRSEKRDSKAAQAFEAFRKDAQAVGLRDSFYWDDMSKFFKSTQNPVEDSEILISIMRELQAQGLRSETIESIILSLTENGNRVKNAEFFIQPKFLNTIGELNLMLAKTSLSPQRFRKAIFTGLAKSETPENQLTVLLQEHGITPLTKLVDYFDHLDIRATNHHFWLERQITDAAQDQEYLREIPPLITEFGESWQSAEEKNSETFDEANLDSSSILSREVLFPIVSAFKENLLSGIELVKVLGEVKFNKYQIRKILKVIYSAHLTDMAGKAHQTSRITQILSSKIEDRDRLFKIALTLASTDVAIESLEEGIREANSAEFENHVIPFIEIDLPEWGVATYLCCRDLNWNEALREVLKVDEFKITKFHSRSARNITREILEPYLNDLPLVTLRHLLLSHDHDAIREYIKTQTIPLDRVLHAYLLNKMNSIHVMTADLAADYKDNENILPGLVKLSKDTFVYEDHELAQFKRMHLSRHEIQHDLKELYPDIHLTDEQLEENLREQGFKSWSYEGGVYIIPLGFDNISNVFRGSKQLDHAGARYLSHSVSTAIVHYGNKGGEAQGDKIQKANGQDAFHEIDLNLMLLEGRTDRKVDFNATLAFYFDINNEPIPDYARKRTVLMNQHLVADHLRQLYHYHFREAQAKQTLHHIFQRIMRGTIRRDKIENEIKIFREQIDILSFELHYTPAYAQFMYGYFDSEFYDALAKAYKPGKRNRRVLKGLLQDAIKRHPMVTVRKPRFKTMGKFITHPWLDQNKTLIEYLEHEQKIKKGTHLDTDLRGIQTVASITGTQALKSSENSHLRQKAESILAKNTYSPEALIDFLKTELHLKDEFESEIGIRPGYTLEYHTLKVLKEFDQHYSSTYHINNNFSLNLFRLVLSLHDIGKPAAIKNETPWLQHLETLPILEKTLRQLGYENQEIRKAAAIVNGDPIGRLLKAKHVDAALLHGSVSEIYAMADFAQIRRDIFFEILAVYYKADVGSYGSLKKKLFQGKMNKNQITHPHLKMLQAAVKTQRLLSDTELQETIEFIHQLEGAYLRVGNKLDDLGDILPTIPSMNAIDWISYLKRFTTRNNIWFRTDNQKMFQFLKVLEIYLDNQIPTSDHFDALPNNLRGLLGILAGRFHLWTQEALFEMKGHVKQAVQRVKKSSGKNPVIIELAAGYGDLSLYLSQEFSNLRVIATDGFVDEYFTPPRGPRYTYSKKILEERHIQLLRAAEIRDGTFREKLGIEDGVPVILVTSKLPMNTGVETDLFNQTEVDEIIISTLWAKNGIKKRSGDENIFADRRGWKEWAYFPERSNWIVGIDSENTSHTAELRILTREQDGHAYGSIEYKPASSTHSLKNSIAELSTAREFLDLFWYSGLENGINSGAQVHLEIFSEAVENFSLDPKEETEYQQMVQMFKKRLKRQTRADADFFKHSKRIIKGLQNYSKGKIKETDLNRIIIEATPAYEAYYRKIYRDQAGAHQIENEIFNFLLNHEVVLEPLIPILISILQAYIKSPSFPRNRLIKVLALYKGKIRSSIPLLHDYKRLHPEEHSTHDLIDSIILQEEKVFRKESPRSEIRQIYTLEEHEIAARVLRHILDHSHAKEPHIPSQEFLREIQRTASELGVISFETLLRSKVPSLSRHLDEAMISPTTLKLDALSPIGRFLIENPRVRRGAAKELIQDIPTAHTAVFSDALISPLGQEIHSVDENYIRRSALHRRVGILFMKGNQPRLGQILKLPGVQSFGVSSGEVFHSSKVSLIGTIEFTLTPDITIDIHSLRTEEIRGLYHDFQSTYFSVKGTTLEEREYITRIVLNIREMKQLLHYDTDLAFPMMTDQAYNAYINLLATTITAIRAFEASA